MIRRLPYANAEKRNDKTYHRGTEQINPAEIKIGEVCIQCAIKQIKNSMAKIFYSAKNEKYFLRILVFHTLNIKKTTLLKI